MDGRAGGCFDIGKEGLKHSRARERVWPKENPPTFSKSPARSERDLWTATGRATDGLKDDTLMNV